jgi:A/G-specific adenine glycosylase
MNSAIAQKTKKIFQNRLLSWHKKNARQFPWRESNDPYCIFLAETLLRKTGAWKAESVYCTIVHRYPSVEQLADADISWLKQELKPLGLFERAELLVNAAKLINFRFKGKIPQKYEDLIEIKGVGNYIAHAIMCFSYNQRVPIVDGSVKRLFCRCFGYQSKKLGAIDENLLEFSASLLPKKNYRNYNYGLLDLASGICKPKKPDCRICILKDICIHFISESV